MNEQLKEDPINRMGLTINADVIHKDKRAMERAMVFVEESSYFAGKWYVGLCGTQPNSDLRSPIFAHGIYATREEAENVGSTLRDLCDMVLANPPLKDRE